MTSLAQPWGRRGWWQDGLVLAGYAFVLLVLFWPVVFGGKVLVPFDNLFADPPWRAFAAQFGVESPQNGLLSDLVLENYAWKQFIREAIRAGELPLWNPYIFAGVPFLAAGQHSALYPLSVLFYVLPLAYAYGPFTLIQLWLAGCFAYIFGRVIGLSRPGAALTGLAFCLSTLMIANVVFPMIIAAMSWLPALLAVIEWMARREEHSQRVSPSPPLLPFIIGAVIVGLQFLAGHVEMSYYVVLVAAFYGVWRLAGLWRRTGDWRRPAQLLLWLAGMGLAGGALAGVQIIPLYELVSLNFRQGSVNYQQVIGWAFPLRQILTFLAPDFFGNPAHHQVLDLTTWQWTQVPGGSTSWGIKNYVEAASYVGVLPLLLALLGLWRGRRPYVLLFAVLAGVSLLFAFGAPAYALLYYGLPGFSQLHTPFRWVFPYTFSVAVLAGLGLDALLETRRDPWPGPRLVGGSALMAGLLMLAGIAASLLSRQPALDLATRLLASSQAAQKAFGGPALFYSYQVRNLGLLALLLAASGLLVLLAHPIPRRTLGIAALGWVAGDLLLFGWGFNPAVDPRLGEFTPPVVEFLRRDQGLFRVTSYGSGNLLWPNAAMLYDIADVRGYDSIIPKQYVEFMNRLEDQSGMLLYNRIAPLRQARSLDSPLLDLLNVKYILSLQPIDRPGYRLVYDSEVLVYENEDVLPRAFVVPRARVVPDRAALLDALPGLDPRAEVLIEGEPSAEAPGLALTGDLPALGDRVAEITSYRLTEVRLSVRLDEPAWLVLTDSYFPGWQAYVSTDGAEEVEVPIYRADGHFRAVGLPAGEHHVRFRYSPMSFKLGLYVSFLGLVALALVAGYWLWGKVYRGEGEEETVRRVVKNSLAPMLTSLANKVIDFAFAAFMLRVLGPTLAGRYYFAIVVVGFLEIFTNFGLNLLMTREVAKDRSAGNRYLSNTALLRLILWGVALPALALYLLARWALSPLTPDTVLAILLLTLALVPANVSAALSSLFYAYEKMEYPAGITTVTTLLKVVLGTLALLMGWGFVGLAGVAIVVNIITAGILFRLTVAHFFRPRLEFDPDFNRQIVHISFPLMLNHLLQTLFFKVDVILLEQLKGDVVVGWYSTAYKWIDALLIIPAYFTMAIFPIMSRYAASARESLMRAYALALRVLVMIALPVAVVTTFIARELITILGGSQYLPHGAIALQIMIWFLPFSFINGVTQYVLIAVDEQRWITKSFLIAAAFNILANLALIPPFGYPAAAFITILSELVLFVPFYWGVRRHVGTVPWEEVLPRPALAALAMAAALWAARPVTFLISLPLAGVIYLGGLLLLGAITEEDRRVLRRLVPGGTPVAEVPGPAPDT